MKLRTKAQLCRKIRLKTRTNVCFATLVTIIESSQPFSRLQIFLHPGHKFLHPLCLTPNQTRLETKPLDQKGKSYLQNYKVVVL